MFNQAVQKMEEHEKKLKLLQQMNRCGSNTGEIKYSETAKATLGGNKLSPCKTSTARSCSVSCCKLNTACSSGKDQLNKSSTDSDDVVAMGMQKTVHSVSKVCRANVCDNRKLDSATSLVGISNLGLGSAQYERNGVSCSGVLNAGHIDRIVERFDVMDQVNDDKNERHSGIPSKTNLNRVNSDSEKKRCTGLHLDLSQEYSVAKFKSRQLLSKQSCAAGLCRSRVFTLHSWNSAVSTHPIESDEWLAFLQHTMEEVMDGDVDALQQCNFVGVVVSPLRNPGASCRVVEYVACLLSLPFVVSSVTAEEVSKIQQVILILYILLCKIRK
jgi:hypothetical protein